MCTGSGEASRAGSGPLWIWQLGGFAADPQLNLSLDHETLPRRTATSRRARPRWRRSRRAGGGSDRRGQAGWRLDSERFRFVPRTRRPLWGRLADGSLLTESSPSEGSMAMRSYLDDFNVDAETKQVLDLALEMTRTALGLADDFANGIIGKRIIELARAGERRPDLLCEGALKSLSGNLFGD